MDMKKCILFLSLLIVIVCMLPSCYGGKTIQSKSDIATRKPLPAPPHEKAFYSGNQFRAVSLKQLQNQCKNSSVKGILPDSIQYTGGLKTIESFIIDRTTKDVILLGKTDTNLPPILLDDFVIALRCAWKLYVENNTFTPPGCSIDPVPATLGKLKNIENRFMAVAHPSEFITYKSQWEETCAEPQTVRVLGIPFNTHFASILVQADYDMKRIIDGSDPIDIPGFVDLHSMISYENEQAINKGKRIAPRKMMNRFWFFPAKYHFIETDNMIILDTCIVTLLTEEQYINKENKNVGKGRTHQKAEMVAQNFSTYYDIVAQKRPIYRQLKELMRMYCVTEALYTKRPFVETVINLHYFLNQFPVKEHPVSKTVQGRSRYPIEKYKRNTARGIQEITLVIPMCGGVLFKVLVSDNDIQKSSDGFLKKVKEKVLSLKPKKPALFWDINLLPM